MTTSTTTTGVREDHTWERRPVGAGVPITVGIAGLAAILALQLTYNRGEVQDDLVARSLGALEAAGYGGVGVSARGRDLTIDVPAGIDPQAARAVVDAETGVRVVRLRSLATAPDQGSDAAPGASAADPTPPATTGLPSLSARISTGAVTLTGTVPSETVRAEVVATVEGAFGAGSVTDRLTVDPAVGDAGLAVAAAATAALGRAAQATVGLADGRLDLSGSAPPEAIDATVSAAAQGLGEPNVTNTLTPATDDAAPGDAADAPADQIASLPAIHFISTLSGATAHERRVIRRAAAILTANPELRVRVEGHTDSFGTSRVNQGLSVARAEYVRGLLVELGVDPGQLVAVGHGESQLLAPDTSAENSARNRRVVFTAIS
jgi:outer membrane protein OmpA-like peptidoglycan-associated protein